MAPHWNCCFRQPGPPEPISTPIKVRSVHFEPPVSDVADFQRTSHFRFQVPIQSNKLTCLRVSIVFGRWVSKKWSNRPITFGNWTICFHKMPNFNCRQKIAFNESHLYFSIFILNLQAKLKLLTDQKSNQFKLSIIKSNHAGERLRRCQLALRDSSAHDIDFRQRASVTTASTSFTTASATTNNYKVAVSP